MNYSPLVDRIKSQGGEAWNIHFKALEAQRSGEDVIILSVGDPEFKTPDIICDSAIRAINEGDTHYSDMEGSPELRAKIAERFNLNTQSPISSDNVIVLPGTQNGLYCAASCLLEAGDEVLIIDPTYLTYEATLKASGATVISVPTLTDEYFKLDPDALRNAITSKTKAIFFANPNNPTGRIMARDELELIAAVAKEFDLWVVADEVYSTLSFGKEYTSIRDMEGMAERTVVLSSLSKSHAMTGWRVGWMIANPTLIKHVANLSLNMFYGLPGFVQQAAVTALDNADDIISQMITIYRRRCKLILEELIDCPSIKLVEPDAGMFMLLDVRGLPLSAEQFSWAFFAHSKVSTLDASAFGASAKGFIRWSFTLSDDRLTEACQRLKLFIADLLAGKIPLPSTDLGTASVVSPVSEKSIPSKPKKVIEVVDLHKQFGDHEVLKGISLCAREGEVISLIGGSGSGKSTLLRCINMLEIPNKGLVYVDGKGIDIDTDSKGSPFVRDQRQLLDIRSHLGMVFQSFNLWPHRTVLENLIEAPIHVFGESRSSAIERAEALLERVGMAHKRDAYPSFLSGGQQQRVAIARALAVEPKAMLFDEPTSALDPELVGEVLKVIRSLAEEGRTMILVTHEMAFARDVSTHVAFLHQGVIEEQGAPRDLFTNPQSDRFRQFINVQNTY